jgi:signal transduction histidine kinase
MSSTSLRQVWTLDPRSLRWRLPFLILGLMLVLLSFVLLLSYREVTRIQIKTAGSRAQFAADQLAEQMAQSNQRTAEAQRLASRPDLARCIQQEAAEACELFTKAMQAAPAASTRVVDVWSGDGRRVLSVAEASASEWAPKGDPPSRAVVGIGPLKKQGKTLYSEFVVEVPAASPSEAASGFVVVRRRVVPTATNAFLKQLVGDGAAIKIGNQVGDVWTDLAAEVPAPAIDLRRPGTARYVAPDGPAFLGALSHIKDTPWALWVEFPEALVLADSKALLQRMIATGTVILVVASLLAWILSRRITTPLSKLTEQAEAIAAGDYTRSVESMRRDEIGRLTIASNEMARRIRDAHDELERRVAERTADLFAANEELESFSYSVSHDLRAPLRHIGGFAALLEQSMAGRLQESDRRYLKTITDAATRMGRLIDDLLAFSRTGRSPIVKNAVRLQPLIEDVQREVASAAQGRSIAWTIHPLPEVEADAAMLRQVLLNLLSNAVKYTSGRSDAEVEIGATPGDNGELTVYVRDNGVGFDMQYVHKLFGVFQRLHRAEEFEGTGIGLANVRRIVQRHGGRVWAEGALNAGATFYFSLPHGASAHA